MRPADLSSISHTTRSFFTPPIPQPGPQSGITHSTLENGLTKMHHSQPLSRSLSVQKAVFLIKKITAAIENGCLYPSHSAQTSYAQKPPPSSQSPPSPMNTKRHPLSNLRNGYQVLRNMETQESLCRNTFSTLPIANLFQAIRRSKTSI